LSRFQQAKDAHCFVLDECSLSPVHAYVGASELCKRAKKNAKFEFGGTTTLAGGDFRQLCPVPGQGELVRDNHIRYWDLLSMFTKLPLTINMRTNPDEVQFAELLNQIGEGRQECHPSLPDKSFMVPRHWVIESGELQELIDWCFGKDLSEITADCAILTHMNKDCMEINHKVI
jgi:PIF1-like helicase